MFTTYLSDPIVYKNLESHIAKKFTNLTNNMNIKIGNFKFPFYNTTFSNGTTFMDANPIFSVKNIKTGDILKIVLDEDISTTQSATKNTELGRELSISSSLRNIDFLDAEISIWLRKFSS